MIVSCPSCQRNYVVADEQIAGKQFRARCKSCGVEFRLDGTPSHEAPSEVQQEPAKFMSATEAYLALQTAPPPSGGAWSVCLSQSDTRRMTTEEVVQALSKGSISSNVFVWKNGMPKWLRLSDVPELMAAAGKSVSRAPQAAVGADSAVAKTDPATRASKPAPPTRFSNTIIGSQPPPPITGTGISARSGQTVPPPPMVPDIAEMHGEANGSSVAVVNKTTAGAIRRSTPAPAPPRRSLDIPVDVDLAPPPAAAAPSGASANSVPPTPNGSAPAVSNAASDLSTPATESAAVANADSGAPAAASSSSSTAAGSSVPNAAGDVVLPPMKSADGAPASGGAPSPMSVSKWPVQMKYQQDAKSASRPPAAEAVLSTTVFSRPTPEASKSKRFAGAIFAMGAVGLVGVIGGVAGAVYVMKSAMGNLPQASASVAVVALQPQAATPAPAAVTVAMAAAVAPAPPPTGDVIDADAVNATNPGSSKSKAVSGGHITGATRSNTSVSDPPKPAAPPKTAAEFKNAVNDLPSLPPAVAAADPKAKAGTPAPATGGAPFNREAASAVLGMAASRASSCKKADSPTGSAKVYVTFDPNGSVVIANVVGAPIAGTPVAQCVANIFRRVKVPPFSGDRSSLSKDFTIP